MAFDMVKNEEFFIFHCLLNANEMFYNQNPDSTLLTMSKVEWAIFCSNRKTISSNSFIHFKGNEKLPENFNKVEKL